MSEHESVPLTFLRVCLRQNTSFYDKTKHPKDTTASSNDTSLRRALRCQKNDYQINTPLIAYLDDKGMRGKH